MPCVVVLTTKILKDNRLFPAPPEMYVVQHLCQPSRLKMGRSAMKRNELQIEVDQREDLPTLVSRMTNDLTELFDTKLSLLKIELREEMSTYIRGVAMIVVGGVTALVGFALLNVALAFLVSTLFENTHLTQPARYALGFVITAAVYIVGGAVLVIISKNKIAEQDLVPPRTIAELRRDKDRLEKEI
jgi:uncharacterized membrane protein YqjE